MDLRQSKICTKCHKSKYFPIIFLHLNIIKIKIIKYNDINEIMRLTIFNINFFKFIVIYFYIINGPTRFCFDLRFA